MDNQELLMQLSKMMDEKIEALRGEMTDMRIEMATKADLEGMATKADLEGMATKADLEGMATKADLKGLITKADLDAALSPLKADVAKLNHTLAPKVEATHEILTELRDKYLKQEELEQKVDEHDDRIWALEQAYQPTGQA